MVRAHGRAGEDNDEIKLALRESRTQYNTEKSADQEVVWSIDPSYPLSRGRQIWYSNGSLFDSSLFANGDGETEINLTATGADKALLGSAYVGQYISHALSEPGIGISAADANVNITDGELSLDHGLIQFGPFFHDGSTGSVAAGVTDGFGIEVNTNGTFFFVRKRGAHVGDSPVSQVNFNINEATLPGKQIDLSLQNVFNFGYGFYNALPLTASRARSQTQEEERRVRQEYLHSENPSVEPLLATPNLPVQVFVSNEGTAETLEVGVGGMQYARYGGSDADFRVTSDFRVTTGGQFTASEPDEPDPSTESGDAFFAYQREAGQEGLTLRDREIIIDPTAAVYVYIWDEWDPATALDGTFGEPSGAASFGGSGAGADETLIQTSTDCTTYTPTIANFRGLRRADAGANNRIDPTSEEVTDRVPRGATRVYTLAARDGSNSVDLDFLEVEMEEAY